MDQICQRTDCKGRRFKKLLDDKGVVSKAEPLQQCFYYRLGRFFDKSEADESANASSPERDPAADIQRALANRYVAMRA